MPRIANRGSGQGFRAPLALFLAWVPALVLALALGGCAGRGSEDAPLGAGSYEGVVVRVVHVGEVEDPFQGEIRVQDLEVRITSGDRRGELVVAENREFQGGEFRRYERGDRVVLERFELADGEAGYAVADVVRRPILYALGVAFVLITVLVAGRRGLTSLLGLSLTFAVVLGYMLPALLAGRSPIGVSISAAVAILFVTLLLTHGIHRQTLVAIAGTAASLALTGGLTWICVKAAALSGMASDEAFYLQVAGDWQLNLQGLFLGSVIIGALGVLDDVTVSQAAVVFALREANRSLGWGELYRRAMGVGREHIASTVNTLVLAYAGASLPLLLLFQVYEVPALTLLNEELVAAEVVRTLAGSIGLIAAVPITTALAVMASLREGPPARRRSAHGAGGEGIGGQGHGHLHA